MPDLKPNATAGTQYDAWAYVFIGLLGIPLLALGVGAMVLPPGLCFGLVSRGLKEGKLSWVLLGGLTGIVWLLLLAQAGRRIMRSKPDESPDPSPTTSTDETR